MTIHIRSFEALSKEELYAMLRLRSEIFVLEQDCLYQDIDNKDQKAFHLLGEAGGNIIAYVRIFKAGDYFKHAAMGRIAVHKDFRKHGYGHDVVNASIAFIRDMLNTKTIEISAQEHLLKFYEAHGFKKQGEAYLEDGIPHVRMISM